MGKKGEGRIQASFENFIRLSHLDPAPEVQAANKEIISRRFGRFFFRTNGVISPDRPKFVEFGARERGRRRRRRGIAVDEISMRNFSFVKDRLWRANRKDLFPFGCVQSHRDNDNVCFFSCELNALLGTIEQRCEKGRITFWSIEVKDASRSSERTKWRASFAG